MGKLEEAKEILISIGMPKPQTNDRCAYVLLALANLKKETDWARAEKSELRIVDMINFMDTYYGKQYKPNSRETIRKDTIHPFIDGAVAERNADSVGSPTNSPNIAYCLTDEMLVLIRAYGTKKWKNQLGLLIAQKGTLIEKYRQRRDIFRVPVTVSGKEYNLSAGEHNTLQKAIIDEFAPRFAHGAEVLYLGDSEDKDLVKNREVLARVGVDITDHDKLPDVILYSFEKQWLFFIEAVTSVGPISVKRMQEIEAMLTQCKVGKIYITAFRDMKSYKKFIDQLAWETEVWIADVPDHMIHLDGDRFIGP